MDFLTVLQSMLLSSSHTSVEEISSLTKTISTTLQILTWSQSGFISTILALEMVFATSTRKVSEGLDLIGKLFHNTYYDVIICIIMAGDSTDQVNTNRGDKFIYKITYINK